MTSAPTDAPLPASPAPAALPRRWPWVLSLVLVGIGIFAYTQLTIFVIQPIGAIPEGRTIIIWRMGKLKFIDSADAMCERANGGVSLLCRGAMMGGVASNATIIARLPYSETLYEISTGGATYER